MCRWHRSLQPWSVLIVQLGMARYIALDLSHDICRCLSLPELFTTTPRAWIHLFQWRLRPPFMPIRLAHHTPLPLVHPSSLRSPTSSITNDTSSQPARPTPSHPTHIQGFVANTTRTTPSHRRSAPNPTSRRSRSPTRPRFESACEACGK